jgi:hypothetical protein
VPWQEDPVFKGDGADPFRLETFSSPAFRLSMLSSFERAHPFAHLSAYRKLFDIFRPLLQARAERLLMIEKPGGSARRRKTVTSADWDPFGHMASVIPADDGHFIGFQFQSGFRDQGTGDPGENIYDAGPALFRFWVGSIIDLDVTIAVDDWNEGNHPSDTRQHRYCRIWSRAIRFGRQQRRWRSAEKTRGGGGQISCA